MAIQDFKILKPAVIVKDLISYVELKLPSLSSSQEFIRILEKKKNENQHSLSFCVFMTNECKSKYYFARENSQAGASVIDIAVYRGGNLIFTIEAKLLPTPLGNGKDKRNEYEYVYGKGAGIQRFKDGQHGRDNSNNLLAESGLIAFIKENDFEYWLDKVNDWIIKANWDDAERLNKIYLEPFGFLFSIHNRLYIDEVVLYHFWMKVS